MDAELGTNAERQIQIEDAYADTFGQGVLALLRARGKSALHFYSWSLRWYKGIDNRLTMDRLVKEFLCDEARTPSLTLGHFTLCELA